MSQDFRFNYERMQDEEDHSDDRADSVGKSGDKYTTAGHNRTLDFVGLDGSREFFSYSYLINSRYSKVESSIVLNFTTHTVVLKGIMLLQLYYELRDQVSKVISCTETRYNSLLEKDQYAVNEILIEKNS